MAFLFPPFCYHSDMNEPTGMREILCIVYGNVQGVFYRRFIQTKAQELGITGTAANLDDGTVEIVAQGPEKDLRTLLESIYAGTDEAEVESANVEWGPVTDKVPDFTIL
jgi:acylphosphatase